MISPSPSAVKGYDSACEDLARHFLGYHASDDLAAQLAQHIQDAIEAWLESETTTRLEAGQQ